MLPLLADLRDDTSFHSDKIIDLSLEVHSEDRENACEDFTLPTTFDTKLISHK